MSKSLLKEPDPYQAVFYIIHQLERGERADISELLMLMGRSLLGLPVGDEECRAYVYLALPEIARYCPDQRYFAMLVACDGILKENNPDIRHHSYRALRALLDMDPKPNDAAKYKVDVEFLHIVLQAVGQAAVHPSNRVRRDVDKILKPILQALPGQGKNILQIIRPLLTDADPAVADHVRPLRRLIVWRRSAKSRALMSQAPSRRDLRERIGWKRMASRVKSNRSPETLQIKPDAVPVLPKKRGRPKKAVTEPNPVKSKRVRKVSPLELPEITPRFRASVILLAGAENEAIKGNIPEPGSKLRPRQKMLLVEAYHRQMIGRNKVKAYMPLRELDALRMMRRSIRRPGRH